MVTKFLTIREIRWFESITSSWVKPASHALANPANGSRESPFTLFGGELGPRHKAHGTASSHELPVANMVLDQSPPFTTLLPAMLMVRYIITHPVRANRFHGRNDLSGHYVKVRVTPRFKDKTRFTPYVSPGSQISHIATNKG